VLRLDDAGAFAVELAMNRNCTIIFSNCADAHSYAVESAINTIGGDAIAVNTNKLAIGESVSVEYRESGVNLRLGSFDGALEDVRSSWNRRFSKMFSLPPNLHPADASFVRDDLRATLAGALCLLEGRFPVNPIAAARIHANKLNQLQVARHAGFRIPKTLISNNYADIQEFTNAVGDVCMKPYDTHGWTTETGPVRALTVRMEKSGTFEREAFEVSPHFFQEYIHKKAEYRAVLFGEFCSCVRIDSSALADQAGVDWRFSGDYIATTTPYDLPQEVLRTLRVVLNRLGLRFGVFDLAETADGDFVFFEVNEGGQWIWQEFQCPERPVLQPFSEFLMQASDSYRWDPARATEECSAATICRELHTNSRFREQDADGFPDEAIHISDERQPAMIAW
jgi:glutathione synthase/RimK-type ligase-like ATP-grasp enzyme